MKAKEFVFLLLTVLLIVGCSQINRISRFADNRVKLGVSKSAFVSKFGKPYSQEAAYGPNRELQERLLYKEELYLESWFIVTTAFWFEDSKLIKQEVLKEERTFLPGREVEEAAHSK